VQVESVLVWHPARLAAAASSSKALATRARIFMLPGSSIQHAVACKPLAPGFQAAADGTLAAPRFTLPVVAFCGVRLMRALGDPSGGAA